MFCPDLRAAQVADHIIPTTPYTSDFEFFHMAGLRGACRMHNNLRGQVTLARREFGEDVMAAEPPSRLVSRSTIFTGGRLRIRSGPRGGSFRG